MNRVGMKAVLTVGFFVLLSVAIALPQEGRNSKKDGRPGDESTLSTDRERRTSFSVEKFLTQQTENLINGLLQLRAIVSTIVTNILESDTFTKFKQDLQDNYSIGLK